MTIEDLDGRTDTRAEKPWQFGAKSVRRRLLAATAGLLIGVTAVAAMPPVARDARIGAACPPTTTRDASGVITVDGNLGLLGDTFSRSGDGSFLILRRGAALGDQASLQFTQIGTTAPATWVQYSSAAERQAPRTPWGDEVAFAAGWKPIAFEGSCWRLIVDGTDSGIVLEVGL